LGNLFGLVGELICDSTLLCGIGRLNFNWPLIFSSGILARGAFWNLFPIGGNGVCAGELFFLKLLSPQGNFGGVPNFSIGFLGRIFHKFSSRGFLAAPFSSFCLVVGLNPRNCFSRFSPRYPLGR